MIVPRSDEPTAAQLARAAERQELILHYQPINSLIGPESGHAVPRGHATASEVETEAGGQDVIVPERAAV